MKSLEEIALARLAGAVEEIRTNLPRLRNAVLESSVADLGEIANRLEVILEGASTASYGIQRILADYGGRRDH